MSSERTWLELTGDLLATPLVELPVERIALDLVSTFQGAAVLVGRREGLSC